MEVDWDEIEKRCIESPGLSDNTIVEANKSNVPDSFPQLVKASGSKLLRANVADKDKIHLQNPDAIEKQNKIQRPDRILTMEIPDAVNETNILYFTKNGRSFNKPDNLGRSN